MSDRRSFLTGAAAALATAAPAALAADDPDADLAALFIRWREHARRFRDAELERETIEDAIEYPKPPEAIFLRFEDWLGGFGCFATASASTGRRWYCGAVDIENLRRYPCLVEELVDGKWVALPNPKGVARRDEIVAAYDRWEAKCGAVRQTSGLDVAQAAYDRCVTEGTSLRSAIFEMKATTLRGLQMKARVVEWSTGDMGDWLAEFDGCRGTMEAVSASICRDLLAMMKASQAIDLRDA